MVVYICCSGALLTCPQFAHQHPWIPTCGAAFQLLDLQPVPMSRLFLPMCRKFPELWVISASSFLQSVKSLLQLPLAILEDGSDICLAQVITSLPSHHDLSDIENRSLMHQPSLLGASFLLSHILACAVSTLIFYHKQCFPALGFALSTGMWEEIFQ